jgi:intraflagellar transport protein 172
MDSEALRVAQKHAPHLAVQIIENQQRRGGPSL